MALNKFAVDTHFFGVLGHPVVLACVSVVNQIGILGFRHGIFSVIAHIESLGVIERDELVDIPAFAQKGLLLNAVFIQIDTIVAGE